jgi:hypothetical protein
MVHWAKIELGVHWLMKFLPKFGGELGASIWYDLLRYSMQTYYLGHVYVVLTGMKWATLVSLSTMTHMESYPAWVRGSSTIKSIHISSHFHSRIFNGCNSLTGLWCSTLIRWHISHNDTYSAISRFMPYHQYLVFRSLVHLGTFGMNWICCVMSFSED